MTNQDPKLNRSPSERSHSHRKPGSRNIVGFGFDFHPEVFITSAVLIFLFVAVTLIFREPAENAFGAIQSAIAEGMGWFFILSVSLYLGFVVFLACSKFGKIR
ncbi:MAG: BCCT family transporter, partial [Cyanobacteria bacterium J06650_10]